MKNKERSQNDSVIEGGSVYLDTSSHQHRDDNQLDIHICNLPACLYRHTGTSWCCWMNTHPHLKKKDETNVTMITKILIIT